MGAPLRVEGPLGSDLGVDGDFLAPAGRRLDLQRESHAIAGLQCMREPRQYDALRAGSESDHSTRRQRYAGLPAAMTTPATQGHPRRNR